MLLETETLPKDGADYRCSFEFTGYVAGQVWRCPTKTTAGITAETFLRLNFGPKDEIALNGRAMCARHVDYLEEFAK